MASLGLAYGGWGLPWESGDALSSSPSLSEAALLRPEQRQALPLEQPSPEGWAGGGQTGQSVKPKWAAYEDFDATPAILGLRRNLIIGLISLENLRPHSRPLQIEI